MPEKKDEMQVIIVVTDKANHSMHYKTPAAAQVAWRELMKARDDHARACGKPGSDADVYGSHSIKDDYNCEAQIRLSSITSAQLSDPVTETEIERIRAIRKMHSDLEMAEITANDPKLKDAQAKAVARGKLALPLGGG